MADLAITALPTASQLSSSDLLYVAIPNPLSPIGFSLCKMTSAQFGLFLNKDLLFASDLETDSKNIIGAINELKAGGGSGGASVIQLTQAEYTALSTAEKMNGSIYKLTDKAIFYCLDEEYHPVKELTSAQYEALTTAEQNNGTIYIQTDAETTGSDIAVSDTDATSIAETIGNVGQLSSAAWSASASSAGNTRLTNSLTLEEKGLYLITLIVPNSDSNVFVGFRVEGWGVVQKFAQLGSLGSLTFPFEAVYDNLSIYFDSQQSGTVNFSYLERGGITAVRIR